MFSDPDTALASIRTALADVTQQIQTARAMLETGRSVDMTGMDLRVGTLCQKALALPPPLARETLPDLEALRGAMDILIDALARRPTR
jgi:hypothetical protein